MLCTATTPVASHPANTNAATIRQAASGTMFGLRGLMITLSMMVRCSLDNQRRDHAKHAVRRLGVRQDVTVKGPNARFLAVHDHVVALAWRDVERVHQVRCR